MPCGDGLHVTRCFRVHVTEKRNMADVDAAKALSGLLSGIAQRVYHNNEAVTEELLQRELYRELPREEFTLLHERMRGLLKVRQPLAARPGSDIAQIHLYIMCI